MSQKSILAFFPKRQKICKNEQNDNNSDVPPTSNSVCSKNEIVPVLVPSHLKSCLSSKYHYQINWKQKYKWLYFDKNRKKTCCVYCKNFLKNNIEALQKSKRIFIVALFTNYRKTTEKTEKLKKHDHFEKHKRYGILLC